MQIFVRYGAGKLATVLAEKDDTVDDVKHFLLYAGGAGISPADTLTFAGRRLAPQEVLSSLNLMRDPFFEIMRPNPQWSNARQAYILTRPVELAEWLVCLASGRPFVMPPQRDLPPEAATAHALGGPLLVRARADGTGILAFGRCAKEGRPFGTSEQENVSLCRARTSFPPVPFSFFFFAGRPICGCHLRAARGGAAARGAAGGQAQQTRAAL